MYRRRAIYDLEAQFDVSVGTVHTVVRRLGYGNMRAQWVQQTAYDIIAGAFAALRGSGRCIFATDCEG